MGGREYERRGENAWGKQTVLSGGCEHVEMKE